MKKILLAIIIATLAALPAAAINTTQTLTISSEPGADSFTTAETYTGEFNASISGSTWSATVTLQRSFDGGTTWVDVDTFASNFEGTVTEPQRGGLPYRIGISNGDYTSGTVYLRLTK